MLSFSPDVWKSWVIRVIFMKRLLMLLEETRVQIDKLIRQEILAALKLLLVFESTSFFISTTIIIAYIGWIRKVIPTDKQYYIYIFWRVSSLFYGQLKTLNILWLENISFVHRKALTYVRIKYMKHINISRYWWILSLIAGKYASLHPTGDCYIMYHMYWTTWLCFISSTCCLLQTTITLAGWYVKW